MLHMPFYLENRFPYQKKIIHKVVENFKNCQEMLLWGPRNGKNAEVIAILRRFF